MRRYEFSPAEVQAGLLVLASAIILAFLLVLAASFRPEGDVVPYRVFFSTTGGLNVNADVRYGGIRVGRVAAIEPDPETQGRIRITAMVDASVPVNAASVASVEQTTLTAEKHLEISTGAAGAERLEPGDRITAGRASYELVDIPDLSTVVARTETLLDDMITYLGVSRAAPSADFVSIVALTHSADRLMNNAADLAEEAEGLLEENRANIRYALELIPPIEEQFLTVGELVEALGAENRAEIRSIVTNLDTTMTTMPALLTRLESLAEGLVEVTRNLETLTGAGAQLASERRVTLSELIADLRATARNVRQFSRTLANQPQSLLRGYRPTGRQE